MNSPVKRYIPIGFVVGDKEYLCSNHSEYNLIGYAVLDMVNLDIEYHSLLFYRSNREEYIYRYGKRVGVQTKIQLFKDKVQLETYDNSLHGYFLSNAPLYTEDLKAVPLYRKYLENSGLNTKFMVEIVNTPSKQFRLPVVIDILTLDVKLRLDYPSELIRMQSRTAVSAKLADRYKIDDALRLFNREGIAYKYGSLYYYSNLTSNTDLVLPNDCEYLIIDKVSRLSTIVFPKGIKIIELHKNMETNYSNLFVADKLIFHKDTCIKFICMLLIDLIQSEDYGFWRNTPAVYDLSVDLAYNLDGEEVYTRCKEFIEVYNKSIREQVFKDKGKIEFY